MERCGVEASGSRAPSSSASAGSAWLATTLLLTARSVPTRARPLGGLQHGGAKVQGGESQVGPGGACTQRRAGAPHGSPPPYLRPRVLVISLSPAPAAARTCKRRVGDSALRQAVALQASCRQAILRLTAAAFNRPTALGAEGSNFVVWGAVGGGALQALGVAALSTLAQQLARGSPAGRSDYRAQLQR